MKFQSFLSWMEEPYFSIILNIPICTPFIFILKCDIFP